MGKKLCFSFAVILLIVTFVGCKTNTLPEALRGTWSLEGISSGEDGILIAGKAFNSYDDFDGEKRNLQLVFQENGTFEMGDWKENLQGKYKGSKQPNTVNTKAIAMNFENGSETTAVFGIREYEDGKEKKSLIFAMDGKIYTFIKMEGPIT